MPSALSHDPSISTPGASTDNAIVIFDGTGGTGFGNSTILVDSGGNGRIGIAADTDIITVTAETVTIAGKVVATSLDIGDGDTTIEVTQSNHSLTVGMPVRVSGANQYAAARATTAALAEVVGIVTAVASSSAFTLTLAGEITTAAAVPDSTSPGDIVYLSTTLGAVTTTEPSAAGEISKPLAVITEANNKMIMLPFRGEVISTGSANNDFNGAELILDVDGDTSITADTDDQIDVKISGADDFRFTANNFHILSGSTLTVDSGATITNSGTANGFGGGAALTGSTNNTVTTVTGANAITGEANLTFDGTNLTVGTGNVIIGTAGKGIDFSVNTQSAVSGAAMVSEVLDWYEEGTWTPIAKDHDGGTMSQQSNGDEGKYTRIGNTVYIQCRVICNGNGSATTSKTLTIHGLPFTHQNATNLQAHPHVGFAAATANPSATVSYGSLIEPGNSFINIMSWDVTTGQSNTVISEFSHDGQLGITGHYFVS